jgi:predicted ArsR family transcriptional regulator
MQPESATTRPHGDVGRPEEVPPDTLNARIGVLTRREVEARLLAPLIETLGARFGRAAVVEAVRETILSIAQEQGRTLAVQMGENGLHAFAESLAAWTQDDALQLTVLERTDDQFAFNVNRCRYAELYRSLGLADLGAVLSCNRDAALITGFNGAVAFERTQTIMQGAPYCDFRYRLAAAGAEHDAAAAASDGAIHTDATLGPLPAPLQESERE